MKYHEVRLTNGSRLGLIKMPGIYSVTLSAFIKAGFKYDFEDKPGLAHLVEHMVFNGTKHYPSNKELSWAIEKFGGWHDAFTWIEYQQHTIHLPKENYEDGIKVLLDTLANPLLPSQELKREKEVVYEEIARNRSDPEKAIWDYAWQPLFFSNTNLARPYSGIETDIAKLTIKDVQQFLESKFLPRSTYFFAAGNFPERIIDVFNKKVGGYNRKVELSKTKTISKSKLRIKVFHYNTEQPSVMCGIRTVPYMNIDRHVINLIREILGGYFGARLPQRLRNENGLIYTWRIWHDNLKETGYLVFQTSTANRNIEKLIKIILDEFLKLQNETVSKKELNIAKGHIAGSLLANTQTGLDFINWYGLQKVLSKNTISIKEQIDIYKRISSEDILRIAQKYFTIDNIYVAVAGNIREEQISRLLKANV